MPFLLKNYYAYYSFQQQMILQTTPYSWQNVLFFFHYFVMLNDCDFFINCFLFCLILVPNLDIARRYFDY